jgi:hypothetical protein
MKVKGSKIHWHEIATHGRPPFELRKDENGLDRIFLVKTDCGLRASHLFEDGSGFSDLEDCIALAWGYEG